MPRIAHALAFAVLCATAPGRAQPATDLAAPESAAAAAPESAAAAATEPTTTAPASASASAPEVEEVETIDDVEEVLQVAKQPPWEAATWADRSWFPYLERGVNLHTARTVKQNALLMVFDHRVNQALIANPVDDFLGFDAGSLKIGLGLRYGILDNLDVGLYRLNGTAELFDVYELDLRYRPISQDTLFVDAAIRAGGTLFWQPGHLPAGGGYAQLVVDREFFDRVLVSGHLLAHSDSSYATKRQTDTDWTLAAGALIEVRLLSFLAWDLEAAVPVLGYGARFPSWSTALKFITHQHTFALIATNTQYTSADGIVAGSDQGPAETIVGFSITRQLTFN